MPDSYVVTSGPSVEPLSLSDLKDSIRVNGSDFDTELTQLLTAGRRQLEHDTKRKLITQTVENYRDEFPVGDTIELRVSPVSSVVSITYIDTSGDSQTLSTDNYHSDTTTTPPRIKLKTGKIWPSTEANTPNAVTITLVAGYGESASDVPAEARVALTQWITAEWGGTDCSDSVESYKRLVSALRWSEYHAT